VPGWRRGKGKTQGVLLSNPMWGRRFLKFLELSRVGRVMADETDEWVVWETVDRVFSLLSVFKLFYGFWWWSNCGVNMGIFGLNWAVPNSICPRTVHIVNV
jgi:hypothetical protein